MSGRLLPQVLDSLPQIESELLSQEKMSYLLVSGCSHTYGVGIDPGESWAAQVSSDLGFDLVNLALPGADSGFVKRSLSDYMSKINKHPDLIIVQWPNPYRDSRQQQNGDETFVNVSNMDRKFSQDLRDRPSWFWDKWIHDIVEINRSFPDVINICFESQDFINHRADELQSQYQITIHIDEKLPGKTWFFDGAATDGLHHSAYCHRKWADRLCTIIKDLL